MSVKKDKPFWKWSILGLLGIGLFVSSRFLPFDEWIRHFTEWVQGKGAWGAIVFAAGYIVGAVAFFPGSLMTIAAGIAFGLAWGSLTVSFSATVGASLAFLIGRYLAREAIEKRAENNEKFKAIDGVIGEEGWKIVTLLRLSPIVPFNLSNYFFGLTKIRFWPYVFASWVGMFPGTVLYVYLGHIGKATLGAGGGERSFQEYAFLTVGLIATLAVTVYLTHLAKKSLKLRRETARAERD